MNDLREITLEIQASRMYNLGKVTARNMLSAVFIGRVLSRVNLEFANETQSSITYRTEEVIAEAAGVSAILKISWVLFMYVRILVSSNLVTIT
jgi:hypothetical protein